MVLAIFYRLSFFQRLLMAIVGIFCITSGCDDSWHISNPVPYKMKHPETTYTLKKKLNEVSGLNMISDNVTALIDDEDGTMFFYDMSIDKIVRKIPFGKNRDWEDVVITGDTAFVLSSWGKLMMVYPLSDTTGAMKTEQFKTPLIKENDSEGMCYDPVRKNLLIACKGIPGHVANSGRYRGKKAIYEFDLKTKKLSAEPVILIDIDRVESKMYGPQKTLVRKLMRLYQVGVKNSFQPSGIAVQPFSHDIYVISASGNVMVVLNSAGKILKTIKLPNDVFRQPEGIAFDRYGNLFICNEGKSGKGNILKFIYQIKKTAYVPF